MIRYGASSNGTAGKVAIALFPLAGFNEMPELPTVFIFTIDASVDCDHRRGCDHSARRPASQGYKMHPSTAPCAGTQWRLSA
jgi:hypothetical protein